MEFLLSAFVWFAAVYGLGFIYDWSRLSGR